MCPTIQSAQSGGHRESAPTDLFLCRRSPSFPRNARYRGAINRALLGGGGRLEFKAAIYRSCARSARNTKCRSNRFSYTIDKTVKNCMLLAAYSQGGVKFPTGGSPVFPGSPRAPACALCDGAGSADPVCKPEPTVKVRKEEDKAAHISRITLRDGLPARNTCPPHPGFEQLLWN